jgi:hypothetical protein
MLKEKKQKTARKKLQAYNRAAIAKQIEENRKYPIKENKDDNLEDLFID